MRVFPSLEWGEFIFPIKSEDREEFLTECSASVRRIYRLDWSSKPPDVSALRPYMCWQPPDVIAHTLQNTTQWGRHLHHSTYRKTYKSIFPAANVRRRNEAVATDSFFADTPAVDNGSTCAQIFVGFNSLYTSVYGMKTTHEFVNTLQDTIRKHGAMDRLISDRAQVEVSNKVLDLLRNYVIGDWQSKPHF